MLAITTFSQPPELFKCLICLDPMEENACSSARCKHSFHKICIEDWLKENNNCPACRTDRLSKTLFVDNKEIASEYHKWKDNPVVYVVPQEDSDSIRPPSLRGPGWQRDLSAKEAVAHLNERLDDNCSTSERRKNANEAFDALKKESDEIKKDQQNIRKDLIDIRKDQQNIRKGQENIRKGQKTISEDLIDIRKDQQNIRKDLIDIRKDQQNIRKDLIDIRKDQQNIRKDLIDIRKDQQNIRKGQENIRKGQENIRKGQENICKGQQNIRKDLIDIRKDQQNIRKGQRENAVSIEKLNKRFGIRPDQPPMSSSFSSQGLTSESSTPSTPPQRISPIRKQQSTSAPPNILSHRTVRIFLLGMIAGACTRIVWKVLERFKSRR